MILRTCWQSNRRLTLSFPPWHCTTLMQSRSRRMNKAYDKNSNRRSISIGITLTSSQAKSFLSLWGWVRYAPYHYGAMLRNGSPKGSMLMMHWSSAPSALGVVALPTKYFGWTRCLTTIVTRKPSNGLRNRLMVMTIGWRSYQTALCRRVSNQNRTKLV